MSQVALPAPALLACPSILPRGAQVSDLRSSLEENMRILIFLSFCATIAVAFGRTPAERQITAAQEAIAKNPNHAEYHSNLALALARRARETADSSYYDKGEAAVSAALVIEPDSFSALKTRAWILLGKHEFVKALELATELNKRMPDDVMVYGFLTDANIELGRYAEAEKSAQWMLNLRPGNIQALTRAAYLREMFGDIDGSVELMQMAYQQLPMAETEDRAWTLTQLGHLHLVAGKIEQADGLLAEALNVFPDYHYALGNLAKVRRAQKRYVDAAVLERKRYDSAPHPENLFCLAEALALAGKKKEAKEAFLKFEVSARAEMNGPDNANHELIFYYIDHGRNRDEALKVAEMEMNRRQDVFTLDAYAWALHANRRSAAVQTQIKRALAPGIKDPKILGHARAILPTR